MFSKIAVGLQQLDGRLLSPFSKWARCQRQSPTRYASNLLENVGAALCRSRFSSVPLLNLAQSPKGVNSVLVPFDQSGDKSRFPLSA